MKASRKKAVAVLAALGLTGMVGAAAASFGGLESASLGSEDAIIASCDSDGVDVSYGTSYSTSAQRFEVDSVRFDAVDAACDGLSFQFTLTDGTNILATRTGTVSLTSGSFSVSVTGVSAEALGAVSLVISG